MPRKKKPEKYAVTGPKDCWHPYGLQALGPEKFTCVVNAIISGQQRMLPVARVPRLPALVFRPLFGDPT